MIFSTSFTRVALIASMAVSGVCFVASAQEPAEAPARPTLTITRREYDIKKLAAPTTLSEEAYRGRITWQQRCAYCHDGVGQPSYDTLGPWLGAETVETLTDEGVRAIVNAGTDRMPGFSFTLTPQQLNEVIAFLKTVSADKKPTPQQLAGRMPGEKGSD